MSSSNSRLIPVALALAVASGAGGFALYQKLHQTTADGAKPVRLHDGVPEFRPEFTLADLTGTPRSIREWDGQVLLINFWATWCPPCQREIPAFIELQEKYAARGFQIVGIAIDREEPVRDFVDTMGINYPILTGEQDAIEIAQRYGNRLGALPYSVVVDRQGHIVSVQAGELTLEEAEKVLAGLL